MGKAGLEKNYCILNFLNMHYKFCGETLLLKNNNTNMGLIPTEANTMKIYSTATKYCELLFLTLNILS